MITATESRRNAHPERPPRRGVARRGSCLVLVAAIGVSMGGCGLFTRNSPTVRGPRVEPRTPAVIVLEHGAGPRRPLRFDLPVGTETEVELRVDLHLTQHGDDPTGTTRPSDRDQPAGRAVVIDPPATYQQVRFTVTGADSSGHDVEFEVVDAGVELEGTILTDVQAVELTAEVQQLVGVRGELRLDRRGAVRSVTFAPLPTTALTDDPDARARTEAQLREVEQQLTSVVPQLPSEPVGRGARWRTAGRSALAGTALRQANTSGSTAIVSIRIVSSKRSVRARVWWWRPICTAFWPMSMPFAVVSMRWGAATSASSRTAPRRTAPCAPAAGPDRSRMPRLSAFIRPNRSAPRATRARC